MCASKENTSVLHINVTIKTAAETAVQFGTHPQLTDSLCAARNQCSYAFVTPAFQTQQEAISVQTDTHPPNPL